MKKTIGLIAVSLLLAACDVPITYFTPDFHQAASAACEKNGGYESLKVWKAGSINQNFHLVIVCNDKAEIFIAKYALLVDKEWAWGEWETDTRRYY